PTHWSKEVENAYRFQLAGYRDETEYKALRNVAQILAENRTTMAHSRKNLGNPQNQLEQTAADYLRTHRIHDLFNNISASLVYNKPEDPKEFMIDFLEKLKKAQSSGFAHPSLIQDNDINSIFRMLDPVGRGYVSYAQYASALEALGITQYNQTPTGIKDDRISQEVFCREA
ncbi:unnamed protein product, partial [Didymodactylos carnosus]